MIPVLPASRSLKFLLICPISESASHHFLHFGPFSESASHQSRSMERGKEEEFACKIAEGAKGIKCEGEEKDMGRVKVGDDGFVTKFSMSCFVVRLVYKCGR